MSSNVHDGGNPVPRNDDSSYSQSTIATSGTTLLLHTLARREAVSRLINQFTTQLQQGCSDDHCPSILCRTSSSKDPHRPTRKFTRTSARAVAVLLATSDHVGTWLCPNLSTTCPYDPDPKPDKIDSKSLTQRLYNTKTFANLRPVLGALHSDGASTKPLRNGAIHHKSRSTTTDQTVSIQGTSKARSRKESDSVVVPLTCNELDALKDAAETPPQFNVRLHAMVPAYMHSSKRLMSADRIHSALSDFQCASKSFSDKPFSVEAQDTSPTIYAARIDCAFRDWSATYQTIIFDSLSSALLPLYETPFGQASQPPKKYETLPLSSTFSQTVNLVLYAIHALTASVPHGDLHAWHVVWSAVVNGRAFGKQRNSRTNASWVSMLDALEFEPGLRLAQRVIGAIAARTCLEETIIACDTQLLGFHAGQRIRQDISKLLVREEQQVRLRNFGRVIRLEQSRDQPVVGTTSRVWLEWLRKCLLKSWDGSHRLNRWSVAGAALELIEDLWKRRAKHELDIQEEFFRMPSIYNFLEVNDVVTDWRDFDADQDPNIRHILSFQFLFDARGLTLLFRTLNHTTMRDAYLRADNLMKTRNKILLSIPLPSIDIAYLDRRLRVAEEPYLVLQINRQNILTDALDQLWHREYRELLRPLRIRMGIDEGEIGHDLGGVQIEFFKLVFQEAFNPDYALFTIDPETRLAWFPPASLVPLYKFYLLGVLFGLAIYNGITLPVSFPLALYRKLLFQPCRESDFREGWPSLAKSMKELCDYTGSVEDDLAREYTFSFTANGLLVDVDMTRPWTGTWQADAVDGKMKIMRVAKDRHHNERKTGEGNAAATKDGAVSTSNNVEESHSEPTSLEWPGWTVQFAAQNEEPDTITNANRFRYGKEYSDWVMDYSIRPQFNSFVAGFYAVLSPQATTLLDAEQLRTLVEGYNHLDIAQLRKAATYKDYGPYSPVVRWFWETVGEYPQEKQKKLLEFVTASSRVPANGAESLTFVIENAGGDNTALPGSSTCFGTLRLPEYESKEILAQKLDIALEHSLGFGQA